MISYITHKSFPIFLFIILSPYYVLPSGLPQPSHIVFIIGFVFSSFIAPKVYIDKLSKQVLLFFFLFILYTFIVNSISVGVSNILNPIIYSFYYVFGLMMMLYIFKNKDKDRLSLYLIYAVVISMSIELLLILLFGIGNWGGVRFSGTFNNPNQLGYFAILSSSIGIISAFYLNKSFKYMNIILILGILLSILSGSRTAVVAILFLYLAVSYYKLQRVHFYMTLFFIILIIYVLFIVYGSEIEMISMLLDRLEEKTTAKHDLGADIMHRGLGRIPDYGIYIFSGMSEGIQYLGYDIEAHNSILAMLYGYGVIGLLFIFVYMFMLLIKRTQNFVLGIIPALLYGMGHNGMRATLLYLLIAISIVLYKKDKKVNNYAR